MVGVYWVPIRECEALNIAHGAGNCERAGAWGVSEFDDVAANLPRHVPDGTWPRHMAASRSNRDECRRLYIKLRHYPSLGRSLGFVGGYLLLLPVYEPGPCQSTLLIADAWRRRAVERQPNKNRSRLPRGSRSAAAGEGSLKTYGFAVLQRRGKGGVRGKRRSAACRGSQVVVDVPGRVSAGQYYGFGAYILDKPR